MPFTNLARAELEKLSSDHAAKYRRTLSQDIPKAERDAQNKRDIEIHCLDEAAAKAESPEAGRLFNMSETHPDYWDLWWKVNDPLGLRTPESVSFYSRANVEG
jgi:hypothetical protein